MSSKKLKAEITLEHGTWTWKATYPNKDSATLRVFHNVLDEINRGYADVTLQGYNTATPERILVTRRCKFARTQDPDT